MDKYKDYIARTQNDRILLDILCAFEQIASVIVPREPPVTIPYIMQTEEAQLIKQNTNTMRENNRTLEIEVPIEKLKEEIKNETKITKTTSVKKKIKKGDK